MVSVISEYVSYFLAWVSATLGLDAWWQFEYSVVLFSFLSQIPLYRKRSNGTWNNIFAQVLYTAISLAWIGCVCEIIGGKKIYI